MLMRFLFYHFMYDALGHSAETDTVSLVESSMRTWTANVKSKMIKESLESLDNIQNFEPHTRQIITSSLEASIRSSYGN